MGKREELIEELRQLEGSDYDIRFSPKKRRRVEHICTLLNECICRNCNHKYDARKSRGDYTGFCSARCQHEKARELGYRKGKSKSEFDVLKRAKCIGNVFVLQPKPAILRDTAHPEGL